MSLYRVITRKVFTHITRDDRLTLPDVARYAMLLPEPGHYGESLLAKSKRLDVSHESLRRSVHRLAATGWVEVEKHGASFIVTPWMPAFVEQAVVDKLRVIRGEVAYLGQWLMQSFLEIIVLDPDVGDEARPEWNVTGAGSGRYEFDRWYRAAGVAFEFQGAQHFRTGHDFVTTEEELAKRQEQDRIKARLAHDEGITLVHVVTTDLHYHRMRELVPDTLPKAPNREGGPIVRYLAGLSRSYINHAARSEQRRR